MAGEGFGKCVLLGVQLEDKDSRKESRNWHSATSRTSSRTKTPLRSSGEDPEKSFSRLVEVKA